MLPPPPFPAAAPQIASEIGCTNLYTAALFYNQQQLKPDTAKALAKVSTGTVRSLFTSGLQQLSLVICSSTL